MLSGLCYALVSETALIIALLFYCQKHALVNCSITGFKTLTNWNYTEFTLNIGALYLTAVLTLNVENVIFTTFWSALKLLDEWQTV